MKSLKLEEIQQSTRVNNDGGGGVGGGRRRRSGHWSRDERDGDAGIGVGDGAIGSRRREHTRGDDKRERIGHFDGSGRREMRVIGGGRSGRLRLQRRRRRSRRRRKSGRHMTLTPSRQWWSQQRKEGGRGGRGGITDHCHRRRRTTRRRKANEGAQAAATKMMATVEEDEAKMIAAIDVRRMNNGADDPDANKDGYDGDSDSDGDGVAKLANGAEVSRRDVDAMSKRGDVRWAPLHRFIVDLLNSNMTLSHYILLTCAPLCPSTALNHAFGGPNNDDSIHVDAPTTIATPQTSSTICWQRLLSIVCDISHGLARYIVSNISCSTKMLNILRLLL